MRIGKPDRREYDIPDQIGGRRSIRGKESREKPGGDLPVLTGRIWAGSKKRGSPVCEGTPFRFRSTVES